MKTAILTIIGVALLVGGCGRKSQNIQGQAPPPPEPQPQITEPQTESYSEKGKLSGEDLKRQYEFQQIAWRSYSQLLLLCDMKKKWAGSFFLEHWEEMEKSQSSEREKDKIKVALLKFDDGKEAEFYAEMSTLASLAVTPEATELEKQAATLYNKWSDRFPDGSGLVPAQSDREQLDREVNEIFTHLKMLPKITSEHLEAEIAALPPPPKTGGGDR